MDAKIKKKYNYWQWRTLIALMVGYTFYYFLRKNFSIAMPAMEQTLGITKTQLGIFLTLNGIVYGISRFVNGFIADRFNKRLMMTAGLVLSSIINFAICFSPSVNGFINVLDGEGKATTVLIYIIGSLWVLNGYVHGMGYPPCASLMAHWFRPKELATKQSIWNASHSIGAGLVMLLCGFLLRAFGYSWWNLCFAVPASLALVGAIAVFFALRDTPSSVGLPEIEELEKEETGQETDAPKQEEKLSSAAYSKFIREMVFKNRFIWIVAFANFFVYVIRFTILDWGSMFLTQYVGFNIDKAAIIVTCSEILGGVLGTLAAGWFTDRFLKNRTMRACLICMIGATVSFAAFWLVSLGYGYWWSVGRTAYFALSVVFIVLSGFFVYGPQALLGVSASQYATKKAAASANGLVGILGYAATTVSGVGFGFLAQHYGWNTVFAVTIVFGVIGAIVTALMWNAPSDGYKRAEKVLAEIQEK